MNRVTTDDTAGASLCSCSSLLALRNPEVASHIKQWGQYSHTYCGCAANSPFIQVCVCFACAGAHAKHTQTCTTTCGRRWRPSYTLLPTPSGYELFVGNQPTGWRKRNRQAVGAAYARLPTIN